MVISVNALPCSYISSSPSLNVNYLGLFKILSFVVIYICQQKRAFKPVHAICQLKIITRVLYAVICFVESYKLHIQCLILVVNLLMFILIVLKYSYLILILLRKIHYPTLFELAYQKMPLNSYKTQQMYLTANRS